MPSRRAGNNAPGKGPMRTWEKAKRVREILATVKPLAAEYYRLTGKPLGVTGELAEYVTAKLLKLELLPPRTKGHDALRHTGPRTERIQIKGRVVGEDASPSQRLSTIKKDSECDVVIVTVLDHNFDAREIWEAPISKVLSELSRPG